MDWKRVLLIAAVVSLAATAALAIGILLFGDFGATEGRILGTTVAVSFASLLALPGVILFERRAVPALAWASIAVTVAALALVAAVIWSLGDTDTVGKAAWTAGSYAVALTQIAGTTVRRRDDDPRSVGIAYAGASGLALVLATMASYAVVRELEDDETFFRSVGALAVLDVFLVALQPFLRRLARVATTTRVVLEGTPEQIESALARLEGTGVRVRR